MGGFKRGGVSKVWSGFLEAQIQAPYTHTQQGAYRPQRLLQSLGRMGDGPHPRLSPQPQPGQPSALPPGTSYQWELVGHPAIRGQLGPKAKGREHLVTVVVLDDLPDGGQRQRVGVQLVGAHVVQGRGLRGVPCDTGNATFTCGHSKPPWMEKGVSKGTHNFIYS